MSNIIILTQYYPPETGAPQNRLHSLAKYLRKHGHNIRILTALPNYPKNEIYQGYKGRYSVKETIDGIPVVRTWIFVNSSRGVVSRLLNYFSFVVTSFFALIGMRGAEYIICESPPLFLGFTAVVGARLKGSKLVFNVSDLWPESAERLNIISSKTLISLAYRLEKWIYRNAYLISGQTKGIVENIKNRFPTKRVVWFPNGIDLDFLDVSDGHTSWREELGIRDEDFVLLYAGIIGHAQGLEVIIQAAELLKGKPIKFLIVGDGPEKEKLLNLAKEKDLTSVVFHPNQQKNRIPSLIRACDAYIVPLRRLDLFKGAIPSKLFEPLSIGKPILLGVDGEARQLFIEEGRAGLYFEPENAGSLAEQIIVLYSDRSFAQSAGQRGQRYVREKFDRVNIHHQFLQQLHAI